MFFFSLIILSYKLGNGLLLLGFAKWIGSLEITFFISYPNELLMTLN